MPIHRLVTAALSTAVLGGCGSSPHPSPASSSGGVPAHPLIHIATVTVQPHDLMVTEEIAGTVRAARSAVLMARVPGIITRIMAVPGSTVAAGDLLVEIDAAEIIARHEQAAAVAALSTADYERAKMLLAKQAITSADFDGALSRAQADAAAATEAKVLVGYTRIRAPFPGIIVRKRAEVGDQVAPGRPVIDVEDPGTLQLGIEIPESLAPSITLGSHLRIHVDAAAIDQDATVVEVMPATDPITRSVLVKLALPGDKPLLRSGQYGRAAIPVASGSVLTVPPAAILHRGQLDVVYVVSAGTVRLRLIRLGPGERDQVCVRAGLAAGDIVALDHLADLIDGQAVASP